MERKREEGIGSRIKEGGARGRKREREMKRTDRQTDGKGGTEGD